MQITHPLTTQAFLWQGRNSESPTGTPATKRSSTGGAITFWPDDEVVLAWYESAPPSSRGRPQRCSDLAITTVLVIKRVFRLTLRIGQGFIDAIFTLTGVPLRSPDYSSVSRRGKSVSVKTPPGEKLRIR